MLSERIEEIFFFFAKVFCVCFVDRIEKNKFFWASLNVIMGSFIYFNSFFYGFHYFIFKVLNFSFHISYLLLHATEKYLAECFSFVKF